MASVVKYAEKAENSKIPRGAQVSLQTRDGRLNYISVCPTSFAVWGFNCHGECDEKQVIASDFLDIVLI